MYSFYSPFTDKQGNPIDIYHLQHRHLIQLSNKMIEEGYQIEYKTELTDSVKRKLPKIITSFANSAGGWLFIGVDEKTYDLDRLEKPYRTDYSQVIAQILREHTSPIPRFEARFLKAKKSSHGVLTIYVYEGINPPYIADGTVYIRNGSSSEPAKSQRSEIDILYQKKSNFEQMVKDYCKREVLYPIDYAKDLQVALYSIYIVNTETRAMQKPLIRLQDLAQKFTSISPNQFHKFIYSNNSVIFQNNPTLGKFQIGVNLEIFSDYSVKIHIPIKQLTGAEREIAIDRLSRISKSKQDDIDDFILLDGYTSFQCFQYIVQQYFDFLKSQKVDLSGFSYQIALEDAQNCILYFDSHPYEEYIKKYGIPFCCKESQQTTLQWLQNDRNNGDSISGIDFLVDFLFMFGMYPSAAIDMYLEALKANPTRNLNRF